MRRLFALAAIVTALCGGARAQSGGVSVAPVLVAIPAERGIGSVTLQNGRETAAAFEAQVYSWAQDNGRDVLTPTRDVVVAPSVFELNPAARQIVRLALAPRVRAAAGETAFRLVIRELPPEVLSPSGPTLLVEMSLPVFSTVRGAAPSLNLVRAGQDLLLANTGAAHARLLEVGHQTAPTVGAPRYLLAGRSVIRPFRETGDALRVVFSDDGAGRAIEQVLRVSATAPAGDAVLRDR